jgi:hypothetical protein
VDQIHFLRRLLQVMAMRCGSQELPTTSKDIQANSHSDIHQLIITGTSPSSVVLYFLDLTSPTVSSQ